VKIGDELVVRIAVRTDRDCTGRSFMAFRPRLLARHPTPAGPRRHFGLRRNSGQDDGRFCEARLLSVCGQHAWRVASFPLGEISVFSTGAPT